MAEIGDCNCANSLGASSSISNRSTWKFGLIVLARKSDKQWWSKRCGDEEARSSKPSTSDDLQIETVLVDSEATVNKDTRETEEARGDQDTSIPLQKE